jgi:hypothetical protein
MSLAPSGPVGLGRLCAALWLLLAPAAPAEAEALFAPPARAAPPRPETPAPESRPADRITSGLFSPKMEAGQGRAPAPRGRETRPENPAPAARQTLVAPAGEKPYWLVEARAAERPYFQAEEKAPELPYWLTREESEGAPSAPYWRVGETPPERPYWEPAPERVEIWAHTVEPAVTAPPSAPGPAGDPRTISYFMYKDEAGLRHLSNVPADPRYREFSFTIDVTVQRGLAGARTGRLRFTQENLRPTILRAAAAFRLDPALIAAVIKSESAFDAHAVSWAGAQGLMQLMPATAREMGCARPFDPLENIMAGSRYLRLMLDTFGGDLALALAAYNCGPDRVQRLWRIPNIPETKNYVVIVTRNYERYKGQF